MTIALSNIVDLVVGTQTPSIQLPNTADIGFFTTDLPDNVDSFRSYINANDVQKDFGTNTETYAMASIIFSQIPSIKTAGGSLVIIPLQNSVKSATNGKVTTISLTSKLTAIKAIIDGKLKVTLNGVDINVTKLNFSKALTVADIVKVLQQCKILENVLISVTQNNEIVFESKKVGANSTVILGVASGDGTDLSVDTLFDTTNSVAVNGIVSSGETVIEAIARTKDQVNYSTIITNLLMEDEVVSALANNVETLEKNFLHSISSKEDYLEGGIAKTLFTSNKKKTKCLIHTKSLADANLFKAGYASRGNAVDYSGKRTALTMNLLEIAGIFVDTKIENTDMSNIAAAGVDCFASMAGRGVVICNKLYYDEIRNLQALAHHLQIRVTNELISVGTKISQTDEGMGSITGSITSVLGQFRDNGVIAGGGLVWNGSTPFGDPKDFKDNINRLGYYVYHTPVIQQSQIDRDRRVAPSIQIAVKLSGAIHMVNIYLTSQS